MHLLLERESLYQEQRDLDREMVTYSTTAEFWVEADVQGVHVSDGLIDKEMVDAILKKLTVQQGVVFHCHVILEKQIADEWRF